MENIQIFFGKICNVAETIKAINEAERVESMAFNHSNHSIKWTTSTWHLISNGSSISEQLTQLKNILINKYGQSIYNFDVESSVIFDYVSKEDFYDKLPFHLNDYLKLLNEQDGHIAMLVNKIINKIYLDKK